MHYSTFRKYTVSLVTAVLISFVSSVHASKYEGSALDPIYDMVQAGQYSDAISELETLLAENADDADVLSLLGYSYRKQQQYEQALNYYQRALDAEPEHLAANEYLGQLYVETGQIDKARERLAVLDDACFFTCGEYKTLKQAIEKIQ